MHVEAVSDRCSDRGSNPRASIVPGRRVGGADCQGKFLSPNPTATVKFLIAGSSGLIGSALIEDLEKDGHTIVRLVYRGEPRERVFSWDPSTGEGPPVAALEGVDVVINLAGISLSKRRWSLARMDGFVRSRVDSTRLLAEALAAANSQPRVFINASAIGFYGHRKDEKLFESSTAGEGFLAALCVRWEGSVAAAREAGIRTVVARFASVLSPGGGSLGIMIPPFKLGTGGWLGDGTQWVSWISLPDAVKALRYLVAKDRIEGAVNIAAPNPVTNRQFAEALGRGLHRPVFMGIPRFAAHLVFGGVVDEIGFSSARVEPGVLLDNGFEFEHPTIDEALSAVL